MKQFKFWLISSVGILFISINLFSQQIVNFNKIVLVNNSSSQQTIKLTNFEGKKTPFYTTSIKPGDIDTILENSKYSYFGISNGERFRSFYKDESNPIKVIINDKFEIIVIGSSINDEWDRFILKYDSLRKVALNHRDQEGLDDSYKREFERYFLNSIDHLIKIDTFITLKAFLRFESDIRRHLYATPSIIDIILEKFNALDLSNHPLNEGNRIENGLSEIAKFRIDAEVENFYGFTIEKDSININRYFDEPLLLLFWASWCGPCRKEGREIVRYYNSIKNNNIEIIGISLDEEESSWKLALEQEKYPWEQIIVLGEEKSRVQNKYLTYAIPKSILLSRQGKILMVNPTITFLTSFSK